MCRQLITAAPGERTQQQSNPEQQRLKHLSLKCAFLIFTYLILLISGAKITKMWTNHKKTNVTFPSVSFPSSFMLSWITYCKHASLCLIVDVIIKYSWNIYSVASFSRQCSCLLSCFARVADIQFPGSQLIFSGLVFCIVLPKNIRIIQCEWRKIDSLIQVPRAHWQVVQCRIFESFKRC